MIIENCPFKIIQKKPSPYLLVDICSPHNINIIRTYGLIDTGASECAVPAKWAAILGHDWNKGVEKKIRTGNGVTIAYSHKTKLKIYNPYNRDLIYETDDIVIDYLENLNIMLLGVHSFLGNFILTIDYINSKFSITKHNRIIKEY